MGEPAGHQYEGHYLQLAGVLGVEKETGFTLGYDKYNWDEHPGHFILQDCTKPVDFGEGKKSIYALPGTEILVQREKEVQMAVHAFGRGRAVYISGLPYSFENSRVLYRSILWSAHDEESLHKWFSSNFNVEVHAYVKNGKYCVVNNTYEPDVYKRQHLLRADVDLHYIRDFLGYVQIETTEVYARADAEMKRKALETANLDLPAESQTSWQKDQSLLSWLQSDVYKRQQSNNVWNCRRKNKQ